MSTTTLTIPEALAKFVAAAQALVDEYHTKNVPRLSRRVLSVEMGRRYARIVKQDGDSVTSRSVYCFVDMTNGDVLKAESWKKPAKHARGNILTPEKASESVTAYGAHYL